MKKENITKWILFSIIVILIVYGFVKNKFDEDKLLKSAVIFGEKVTLEQNKNYYSVETDNKVKANYVNNNFIGCENNTEFVPNNKNYNVSTITNFPSNKKEGNIIVTISKNKRIINKYRFDIITTESSIKDREC